MAFPQVASVAGGGTTSNSTSYSVTLPSGVQNGDLLILILAVDGSGTITMPGGWTELQNRAIGTCREYIGYKIASSESNFSVTFANSEMGAHTIFRITGHDPATAVAIGGERGSTGSMTSYGPDPLTSGFGEVDTLWIAFLGHKPGTAATSGYLSNYTSGRQDRGNDSSGVSVSTCRREYAGPSQGAQNNGFSFASASLGWTGYLAIAPAPFTAHTKTLTETATATATFSRTWTLGRTLTETATAVASVVKTAARVLMEAVEAADAFFRSSIDTISVRVNAGADDGVYFDGAGGVSLFNDNDYVQVYEGSSDAHHGFVRFPNIAIPAGSTISDVRLTFTSYTNDSTNLQGFYIYAVDADDVAQPSPFTSQPAVTHYPPLTTAFVTWEFGDWTINTEYVSDNLATVLQEVIDRGGWQAGNAIMFILRPFSSSYSEGRRSYAYDGDPDKAVLLEVSYASPGILHSETFADTATAADALVRGASKLLSEAATAGDGLVRSVARTVVDTATSTAEVLKGSSRALAETATAAESLLIAAGKVLNDTATATDSSIRSIVRILSDTGNATADILKTGGRSLTETVTASDLFSRVATFGRSLAEEITATADILRGAARYLAESATATDSVVRTASRSFSEAATAAASLVKTALRTLSEAVTGADDFDYSAGKTAILTETAQAVASLTRTLLRTIAEGIEATATLLKTSNRTLADSASATSSVLKGTTRTVSEAATATDAIVRMAQRTLSETASALATLLRSTGRAFTEPITATVTLTRDAARSLLEAVTGTDQLLKTAARFFEEAATATDTFLNRFIATPARKGLVILRTAVDRAFSVLTTKRPTTVLKSKDDHKTIV